MEGFQPGWAARSAYYGIEPSGGSVDGHRK
jgi:hypothetical protein